MSSWPEVDYDPAVWIELPSIWCEATWPDHRSWARDIAEACWGDFDLAPGPYAVDNLALALALYVEKVESGDLPAQDFFLHLPDPRLDPLLVSLGVWELEGGRPDVLLQPRHRPAHPGRR